MIEKEKFLDELVKVALQSKSDIGCFSPIIYYYDVPNIPQYAGKEYFSPLLGVSYLKTSSGNLFIFKQKWLSNCLTELEEIIDTELITGAAVMFKRDVLLNIGLLDESMFMGWEDIKYSLSLRKYGYRAIFIKSSKVFHKGSVKFVKYSPFRVYQDTKNKIYVLKHLPFIKFFFSFIFNIFLWIPIDVILICYKNLKNPRKVINLITWILFGIIDGIKTSPVRKKRG